MIDPLIQNICMDSSLLLLLLQLWRLKHITYRIFCPCITRSILPIARPPPGSKRFK